MLAPPLTFADVTSSYDLGPNFRVFRDFALREIDNQLSPIFGFLDSPIPEIHPRQIDGP
jgi:hypothetical protein